MITLDQLKKILIYAGPRAGVFHEPLCDAMTEFGIDTPMRQAAFLAQIAHESGSLKYVREIASGEAYEGRRDLGNTEPGDASYRSPAAPTTATARSASSVTSACSARPSCSKRR